MYERKIEYKDINLGEKYQNAQIQSPQELGARSFGFLHNLPEVTTCQVIEEEVKCIDGSDDSDELGKEVNINLPVQTRHNLYKKNQQNIKSRY